MSRLIFQLVRRIKTAAYKFFWEPIIKRNFASCGKHVRVGRGSSFSGIGNISIGDHSIVGGVPAKVIKMRFTPEEITEHENILALRGNNL